MATAAVTHLMSKAQTDTAPAVQQDSPTRAVLTPLFGDRATSTPLHVLVAELVGRLAREQTGDSESNAATPAASSSAASAGAQTTSRAHTPLVIADAMDQVPAALDVQHLAEYILETAFNVPSDSDGPAKKKPKKKKKEPIPKTVKAGCESIPGGGLEVYLPSENDSPGRCEFAHDILAGQLGASSFAKVEGGRARITLSQMKYGFDQAVGRLRERLVAPYILTDTAASSSPTNPNPSTWT